MKKIVSIMFVTMLFILVSMSVANAKPMYDYGYGKMRNVYVDYKRSAIVVDKTVFYVNLKTLKNDLKVSKNGETISAKCIIKNKLYHKYDITRYAGFDEHTKFDYGMCIMLQKFRYDEDYDSPYISPAFKVSDFIRLF